MIDLFRPSELRAVLRQLQAIDEELLKSLLGGDIVHLAQARARKSAKEIVSAVRGNSQSPEVIAWILLSNVAVDQITYTNPFTYRGVLSQRGIDYLKVWTIANGKLVELGHQTQQDADEDATRLRKQIQEQG